MEFYKKINIAEVYIYLLIISAFISISVFEIFVGIGLLAVIYQVIRKKVSSGMLSIPILIYTSTALISTLIFNISQISKAIEQGFFQIIYFLNLGKIDIKKLSYRINGLLIVIGILLIPIILYKYFKKNTFYGLSAIWGGPFEVANFYTIFSFTAFFTSLYFFRKKKYLLSLVFFFIFIAFLSILFISHRRTYMLSFFILFYIILVILLKNNILKKAIFILISLVVFLTLTIGYIYLSKTDNRFIILNKVIIGEKEINKPVLNAISSARYRIIQDAIEIIKTDIKEKKYINLLIGHGINSGYYLPHKYSPKHFGKYESIFIVSELIEIGIVGLLAEIIILFLVFKFLFTLKLSNNEDILALTLIFPLAIHLLSIFFTFFWDALLPLYFLLFKLGERYFKN